MVRNGFYTYFNPAGGVLRRQSGSVTGRVVPTVAGTRMVDSCILPGHSAQYLRRVMPMETDAILKLGMLCMTRTAWAASAHSGACGVHQHPSPAHAPSCAVPADAGAC